MTRGLTRISYRPSSETTPSSRTITRSARAMDDSRWAAKMTVMFCSRMIESIALFTAFSLVESSADVAALH